MPIVLDGTAGITTPEIVSTGGPLVVNASAPDNSLVVNASGNVGIGTSSPSVGLSIQGTTADAATIQLKQNASGGQDYRITSRDDGSLRFNNDTAGAERMRIDSSGNLLVGTTSKILGGIFGLDINDASAPGISLAVSGAQRGYFFCSPSVSRLVTESVSGFSIINVSGGSGGVVLSNGATSWAALSDERKKDIIEPIVDASSKVASLRAVIGKYKTDAEGTRRAFLIAQDVQAVLPEAVVEDNGDLLLQYTEVIPLLVAAIQELKAINDAQAQTIESLTARVVALEQA